MSDGSGNGQPSKHFGHSHLTQRRISFRDDSSISGSDEAITPKNNPFKEEPEQCQYVDSPVTPENSFGLEIASDTYGETGINLGAEEPEQCQFFNSPVTPENCFGLEIASDAYGDRGINFGTEGPEVVTASHDSNANADTTINFGAGPSWLREGRVSFGDYSSIYGSNEAIGPHNYQVEGDSQPGPFSRRDFYCDYASSSDLDEDIVHRNSSPETVMDIEDQYYGRSESNEGIVEQDRNKNVAEYGTDLSHYRSDCEDLLNRNIKKEKNKARNKEDIKGYKKRMLKEVNSIAKKVKE